MTDTQLYLAVALPILANGALIAMLLGLMNAKFDAVNHRFDDMRDLSRVELHRVEEVLGARLKHIEESQSR